MSFGESLLVFGLSLPLLSWLGAISELLAALTGKRSPSRVLFPFIGPILLTWYILIEHHSPWWIVAVWLGDIGTIGFLPQIPSLVRENRKYSRYTRILEVKGSRGNQSAIICLQKSGVYSLKKSWESPKGAEGGTLRSRGMVGRFTITEHAIHLIFGGRDQLTLIPSGPEDFTVAQEDLGRSDPQDFSLLGCILKVDKARDVSDTSLPYLMSQLSVPETSPSETGSL